MAGSSYSSTRKLGQARSRELSVVSQFKLGYRNREDITSLPPGTLIVGSQDVLSNVSERIQIRQGYALDGATSDVDSPVSSSFDWITRGNGERHIRAGGLTSAGNDGRMQYRYVDSTGAVTWRDLLTGLTTVDYNFATFWDTTENLRRMLFVNGTSNIFNWNGALGTVSSTDNATGHVTSVASAPTAGGSGYGLEDILTIASGGTGATIQVTGTSGTTITSVVLLSTGSGYSTGTGKTTTGGGGTGATIDITGVANGQIILAGTESTVVAGFDPPSGNIVINGTTYSYTNVFGNSFLGISPDPSAIATGSIIHQAVAAIPNSEMTDIPVDFPNSLIATLNNQVFVGSTNSSALYISNVNSFIDYSQSSPRESGEGAVLILDDNLIGMIPQENYMYVTAGKDLWYNVSFTIQTSTVGVTYEQVSALPLKTGRQQAAKSQAYISHMKNDIIMLSNEPTIDTFGRVESSLVTPQTTNISDPIKLDMDQYDFSEGSIAYWRYYILVSVPREGLIRIYNLNTNSWEAPQTIPISRFYIVDGELYGHSFNTFESYQLFTGYADRVYTGFTGFPIAAKWVFSYENYGSRFSWKTANELYVEGYINANTILGAQISYELDGCQTIKTFEIDGSDKQIVCVPTPEGSLGKESLGKEKLGGAGSSSLTGLPPKFRVIKTFNNTPFFECSISFFVYGTDERAEILCFGLNAAPASEEPTFIKQ